MSLKLMYITNRPNVAKIAEDSGVQRIFVDLEWMGKELRQPGDTVKSAHTIKDIYDVKKELEIAQLLARVNPLHENSKTEISACVEAGADIVMLPMAKSLDEVKRFVDYTGSKAKTMLLLETKEAVDELDAILQVEGIDEIHIGLNDLHLSYKKKFMFELLADGTVEKLCHQIKKTPKPYGFGGIARIGFGLLPAEYIIAEHYRLGSGAAILSRSFCNIKELTDEGEIRMLFVEGVRNIRACEARVAGFSSKELEENRMQTVRMVEEICKREHG